MLRILALAICVGALGCGAAPCREAVETVRIDAGFRTHERRVIEAALTWWASVDQRFAVPYEYAPVVPLQPGALARIDHQPVDPLRGQAWAHCAMVLWPIDGADQRFRTVVHEFGHFFGLGHVERGLMTPDSARSTLCLTTPEAIELCKVNGCVPSELGHLCE